jgi:hypothetical protein
VKGHRILLGVAVALLVIAAVGVLITEGPWEAIQPALLALAGGVIFYRLAKHPMPPMRWDKKRTVTFVVVVGPVGVVMVATLIWVLVTVPDWPVRALAIVGLVFVPAVLAWTFWAARREDQTARTVAQES